jgi:hypothetical protein
MDPDKIEGLGNGLLHPLPPRILLSYVKIFVCLIERPFTTEYQV